MIEAAGNNQYDGRAYLACAERQESTLQVAIFPLPRIVTTKPLYLFCVDDWLRPMSGEKIQRFIQDIAEHVEFDVLANGRLMEDSPATERAGGPKKGGVLDKYNLINIARKNTQFHEFLDVPTIYIKQMFGNPSTLEVKQ